MAAPWHDVFVGSETGFLKGVNIDKKYFENVNKLGDRLDKEQEIQTMCWDRNSDQTRIYCGLRNRKVKLYDTRNYTYEDTDLIVDGGEGPLRGFAQHDGGFITCVDSGLVKVWNEKGEEKTKLDLKRNVHRMRQNGLKPWMIATGGKKNDLQLWDLNNLQAPIFKAKNVPHDFLQLEVPIWVTDMQFFPQNDKVAVCTGHSHVRVYDPSTSQKRPVIEIVFDEYPITAMSLGDRENYVIAGNSRGKMGLFDMRKPVLMRCYRGFAGSIRSIQMHPTQPLVASCGLDRFLRIHNINSMTLLHKVYLKSRLNCLLYRGGEPPADVELKDKVTSSSDGVSEKDEPLVKDPFWDEFETVGDNDEEEQINPSPQKKKRTVIDGRLKKSLKKKRKAMKRFQKKTEKSTNQQL